MLTNKTTLKELANQSLHFEERFLDEKMELNEEIAEQRQPGLLNGVGFCNNR